MCMYEHALIFVPVSFSLRTCPTSAHALFLEMKSSKLLNNSCLLVHEDLTLILLCDFKHFGSNFLLFSFFLLLFEFQSDLTLCTKGSF